jgi:hydroxypyruvate isomerase
MNRRTFLPAAALAPAALSVAARVHAQTTSGASKGRLKQCVTRWCLGKIPIEDLARETAKLGFVGIDLVGPDDWPVLRKYGLLPSMVTGAGSIAQSWNRKENHAKLEKQMLDNIALAAKNKLPNVITFSGERKGQSDEEGLENCVIGLNKVKAAAEDAGITINLELLNSKVNHPDYQCDKTAWGVEVCKRVNSPRVKLLYDIYHMQIMEGDLIRTIKDNFQYIGHFHTAGNPGRNEIDETQEIYYPPIAKTIADLGYTGYFAHEFVPKRDPWASLKQAYEICTV